MTSKNWHVVAYRNWPLPLTSAGNRYHGCIFCLLWANVRDSSHARFVYKSSLPVFADNGSLLFARRCKLRNADFELLVQWEWMLSGTDYNSYYCHDMLLDKPHSFKPADLENAPLFLTHSKPDNGHAPFRIQGALRLFNLCEQNRKLSECLVFLWSGRGCICQTEHLLRY